MYLQAFNDNPFDTNCWLLALEGSEEAVVVDPGFYPDRIRSLLAEVGKRPVAALATHGHADHVGSVVPLCTDIPLYIHKDDELALTDARAWGSGWPDSPGRPNDVRTMSDGDVLDLAGFSLEVLHTPGHTPGSVCFRISDALFSGDLVFAGAIGRYDFPNSSARDMEASLRRFLTLPDDLRVLPGHGPDTSVGVERRTNPFLIELR
jgi:glyoxylase-like metal-dependent hydrolase (beta-lactamase superfamily II)